MTETRENPKAVSARRKPGLGHVPPSSIALVASLCGQWGVVLDGPGWFAVEAVLAGGAEKYGRHNWRQDHILFSTYFAAALRHLQRLASGEGIDTESRQSHWAHVAANAVIVLDAENWASVVDDREHHQTPEIGQDAVEFVQRTASPVAVATFLLAGWSQGGESTEWLVPLLVVALKALAGVGSYEDWAAHMGYEAW